MSISQSILGFSKEEKAHMKCPRCDGLMVPARMSDLMKETGELLCEGWRCVNCGEVVDSVVLKNRLNPQEPAREKTRRSVRLRAA